MARGRAAYSGVRFVFARMTHHLGRDAAGTPKCATDILAALAVLFGNLVSLPNGPAGAAQRDKRPCRKDKVAGHAQNGNVHGWGRIGTAVRKGGNLQRQAIHEKGHGQHQHDHEGLSRHVGVPNAAQPRELHPCHDLGHGHLRAPQAAAQRGVAESCRRVLRLAVSESEWLATARGDHG
jgi:hypothetical protein